MCDIRIAQIDNRVSRRGLHTEFTRQVIRSQGKLPDYKCKWEKEKKTMVRWDGVDDSGIKNEWETRGITALVSTPVHVTDESDYMRAHGKYYEVKKIVGY